MSGRSNSRLTTTNKHSRERDWQSIVWMWAASRARLNQADLYMGNKSQNWNHFLKDLRKENIFKKLQ